MIILLTIVLSLTSSLGFADSFDQKTVDDFFQNHEPTTFKVFCRSDLATPDCRTITWFKDSKTNKAVQAFQISFVAPIRPLAATELFIPVHAASLKADGSGSYVSYVDSTMDGGFKIAKMSEHQIERSDSSLSITDLPFGRLTFNKDKAVVNANNGMELIYTEMK